MAFDDVGGKPQIKPTQSSSDWNPIHMQGSVPGFESGVTEMKGRQEITEPTWLPAALN